MKITLLLAALLLPAGCLNARPGETQDEIAARNADADEKYPYLANPGLTRRYYRMGDVGLTVNFHNGKSVSEAYCIYYTWCSTRDTFTDALMTGDNRCTWEAFISRYSWKRWPFPHVNNSDSSTFIIREENLVALAIPHSRQGDITLAQKTMEFTHPGLEKDYFDFKVFSSFQFSLNIKTY